VTLILQPQKKIFVSRGNDKIDVPHQRESFTILKDNQQEQHAEDRHSSHQEAEEFATEADSSFQHSCFR
jgi:hypothetical protein